MEYFKVMMKKGDMMRLSFLLLFILLSLNVLNADKADIEQFYKKITNKTVGHSMRNVDFIYMINLDHRRSTKFESCKMQLTPYKINPFRFSVVNGWEIPFETKKSLGLNLRRLERKIWEITKS